MKRKPTLTIGIPAHNEEANIERLLNTLVTQKGNFVLEKILVVCDGCTDRTEQKVKEFAKTHKIVKILNDKKRYGKASRLNQIYALNKSELLGTFDGDILLARDCEIDLMVKEIQKNPKTNVVAARLKPFPAQGLIEHFSVVSFLSFEDAILRLNNGNNYYSLIGCASMLRGSFAKTFTYPTKVISDMNYLYTVAIKNNPDGVKLARETQVIFRTVRSFHDWRVLGQRSVKEDKQNLTTYFGEGVLQQYSMPKWISVTSQLKWLLKSPIYMTGSIILNIFIRLFPLQTAKPHDGIWEDTRSSKDLSLA
ncbi:glycosyltransferase family 2 protein [Patescibacteria group bacterium]|nr:glycosyltransferase family 2 protein [Patescibacteria group bacterium]